ncbi:hypothetical protein OXPF_43410 [Oxobacter pfennigii]|uniref:Uncharacterized protein n=1 Tax=Oxobacter pfennigii TaxID=36849 RepID=A0A0P9ABU5_9CLOT|nr:hypothetical protein OXPF_43410 [Oxobacter pfennigii]
MNDTNAINVIEVIGLTKHLSGRKIIDNIDLTVRE